ncbi:MAG TPA: aspartate carbamoyltransferase regulatory subunit [Methanothermococcus okinawensis]|uniref:Aspartate carbamoyltransferase regulatory chain n=1 Tax=Methanofervidicoccus abyssi TaxID=2082189 RepID=A0A401HPI1_9EURY|nr:aspartate carbamoyltransferase regulatory subunit [Methanofervidicoccus abyssi]GBF36166.1 aspartate carbamoyltransferase regulatory subunit [Methanofervidicoccus abyssi]HIP16186.1 aspartate carbamoyltransferase regulatory subunit [Methanothermococcus okinawensis]
MERSLKVRPIENGTVIDHITKGKALNVYRVLNIGKETTVTIAMYVPSKKYGKKDILKIEGVELSEEDVNKIALISPNATINIIKNRNVVKKFKVKIPDFITGILKCTNPNCITNIERVSGKFKVEKKNPLKIRCIYCEKFLNTIEIPK